ncbi:MAG: hypothetical protein EOO38_14015 [Cytophagaceae bacterium]|nr:MAG: hypothetical protein EOO38_14015 [Cytophagaceae bacterium]
MYGYTELRPPSTLLAPGALVSIISRDPFQAAIICGPKASLGPQLELQRSQTASGTVSQINNSTFSMDAGWLDLIRAEEKFSAVGSVTMTVSNAVIVEVRDEDVLMGLEHRSRACREAVRRRVEGHYTISMVASALMGDVVYSIKWSKAHEQNLSKSEKIDALQNLAVKLGGSISSESASEIRAQGLVWGIRDDEFLSAMAITYVAEENFERNTRHLPDTVTLDNHLLIEASATPANELPDAPVLDCADKASLLPLQRN